MFSRTRVAAAAPAESLSKQQRRQQRLTGPIREDPAFSEDGPAAQAFLDDSNILFPFQLQDAGPALIEWKSAAVACVIAPGQGIALAKNGFHFHRSAKALPFGGQASGLFSLRLFKRVL
ncbi:MAG: hypothetical protein HC834_00355 [Rhodospirillales bacterium]|nr:hypothetical protein [Rhodospirillales bacterium]